MFALHSCKVSYSFTGATINPAIETFSVQYFPNRAEIIQPTLSQEFTDALRQKMETQTRLNLASGYGDVNFEGEITAYDVTPQAITGNEAPALNRLTVSVNVRFTNLVEPENDFEKRFTRYEDFSATQDLSQVESELIIKINEQLTEDIFNEAFVNW